ncbi:hypothetical protein BDW22DRAFT_1424225 [Trametopsis cervina]|nr:hypothetical protein BDW22DRAFT_1424225 [Trametopsis cervina]
MPKTNRTASNSSSLLSPTSPPSWAPPRAPLSPHRLAKLANVLGVPTPIPATHPHAFSMSSPTVTPSPSPSPLPYEMIKRSPTPSTISSPVMTTSSTSRYMLHVIPPMSLPHDTDENDLTLPPPNASGYHSQFHRGVLIPVYSTFQSQLSAIAKEYALPSTTGLELFLVTSLNTDESKEPGARLSELIWKHIWARVLKVEKDELHTPGPRPLGLGINYSLASRSTPSLLQDVASSSTVSLRSIMPPETAESRQPSITTITPSPSTPSQSIYTSQSELDTVESASSIEPPMADILPLPGLGSSSLLPVLAKVEFEIDRRKANWYDPWIKSRRVNYAKRAESRQGRNGSRSELDEDTEGPKKAPIDLALVGKLNGIMPNPELFLTTETSAEPEEVLMDDEGGYQQLDEDDELEGDDEELTARLNSGEDPLEDVFGNDADNWTTMQNGKKQRNVDPNVVDLALDASALDNLPDDLEADDDSFVPDEDAAAEVSDLLEKMSKPELSVAIPVPAEPVKRQSSPLTAGTTKRHVPPPITIVLGSNSELGVPEQPTPITGGTDGARLAYLATPSSGSSAEGRAEEHDDYINEDVSRKMRSPEDDKRVGVFFDELDLGLDPSLTAEGEFDESDPYDRRKSQYIMAAQLDALEKNLAQLSPRRLQSVDLKPEDLPPSRHGSPAARQSPSITSVLTPRNDGDFGTPTKSPVASSWPAVPYSTINGNENTDDSESRPPSPPTFAFNGISTEPPKSFVRQKVDPNLISSETLARQRALQEDNGLYPPLVAPAILNPTRHEYSPVIPLSPDPFGRFPSEAEATHLERESRVYYEDELVAATAPDGSTALGVPVVITTETRPPSQAPSSRFSLDSVTSEEVSKNGLSAAAPVTNAVPGGSKPSGALSGVKSIRRLWRRSESKRASVSSVAQPPSGRISPNAVPPQNGQPGRSRSKSISKAPPIPSPTVVEHSANGLAVPNMPAREPSRESMRQPIREPPVQSLRFDQESPYPIHPSRASTLRSPSPPPQSRPPSQQANRPPSVTQQAPTDKSSVRKSILKSWKSASGLSTGNKGSTSSTPRSSTEQLPETAKKRRPSVIDFATGALRGSGNSTLGELPPSPAIPEQFFNQMRSSSRQSQLSHTNGKPSISSSASASSPPRVRSPLTAASSPPRQALTAHPRASMESYESRPSFDVSQFEMVSPPHGSLSYPYHSLDQSTISSHE